MSLEIWSSVLTFVGSGILAYDAIKAPRHVETKETAGWIDDELQRQRLEETLKQAATLEMAHATSATTVVAVPTGGKTAGGNDKAVETNAPLPQSATRDVEVSLAKQTRRLTIWGFVVMAIGFLLDLIVKSGLAALISGGGRTHS